MPISLRTLPAHYQTLFCVCILAGEYEIAGDIWSTIVDLAESDQRFREAVSGIEIDTGAMGKLRHICNSVTARIAAEEAVNSLT